MDILTLSAVVAPIALAITGYMGRSLLMRIEKLEDVTIENVTEAQVRQIMSDKVDPVNDKIDKLDAKFDKLIDRLLISKYKDL